MDAVRLRELLDYDPATGEFRWKVRPTNSIHVGDVAGGPGGRGDYWAISVDRERTLAHRLAWLYVYGVWPTREVDHLNEIKRDNRIANLDDATHSQNGLNQSKPRRDNKSGFRGVSAHGPSWRAEVTVDGKRRCLGVFATAEEAGEAYRTAKQHVRPERRSESA